MTDDTTPTFSFPAVSRKKITAAFDGGRLSSDGGVMLLAQAERRLGIAVRVQETTSRIRLAFASCCPDADLFSRLASALAPQPRAASP